MVSHNIATQTFLSGSYIQVGSEVDIADPITVERGFTQEGELRPAKITWTYLDPIGKWDPDNPTSTLYGVIGRNTIQAAAIDAAVIQVAETSVWEPDQTIDYDQTAGTGRRWSSIEAEGILRRLGEWTAPIRSPMYNFITQFIGGNLSGHWPLEDDRSASVLTNTAPGRPPGYFGTGTLGNADGPAGADTVATLGSAGFLSGQFPGTMSTTAGFQLVWSCYGMSADATQRQFFRWATSTGYDYSLTYANDGTMHLTVINNNTGLTVKDAVYGSGLVWTTWNTFRVKIFQNGGNVQTEVGWYDEGNTYLTGFTELFVGTIGRPLWWRAPANVMTNGASYSHVYGMTGIAESLNGTEAVAAINGYRGETAGDRFLRITSALGISRTLFGSAALTMTMGRQRVGTILDQLKEIMDTEDGLIFDRPNPIGLVMRTRIHLSGQTPKFYLSYPLQVGAGLRKRIDSYGIKNLVTIKNSEGSEITRQLSSGAMSTQPTPNGIGEYRQTVDVSVFPETQLPAVGDWRLARGTIPGARWPSITIDTDRDAVDATLRTALGTLQPGDRIWVVGRTPDPIDVMVIGIQDRTGESAAGKFRRQVTLTCIPYAAFDSGVYDTNGHRYDSASSSIAAATSSATTWTVSTDDVRDTWSTTAVPYDCEAGGERVTVTAMTAPTGTGPYTQTATVTRAVNGVAKAQTTGTPFSLATPVRFAL